MFKPIITLITMLFVFLQLLSDSIWVFICDSLTLLHRYFESWVFMLVLITHSVHKFTYMVKSDL